jgi:hypothetical protein
VKDSRTGEVIQRKRPATTVTLSSLLLDEIDKLSKDIGKSRSEIVERCILIGLPVFKKNFMKEEKKEEKRSEGKTIEERFMRKLIFDSSMDDRWEPV